jgi:hypothetical protein
VKQDGEIKLIRDFLKITVLTYTTKDSGYQAKCIGASSKYGIYLFFCGPLMVSYKLVNYTGAGTID